MRFDTAARRALLRNNGAVEAYTALSNMIGYGCSTGSCPMEWCSWTVAEPLVKRAFLMAP